MTEQAPIMPQWRIDCSALFAAAGREPAVYDAFQGALTALGWNYDISTDTWLSGSAPAPAGAGQ